MKNISSSILLLASLFVATTGCGSPATLSEAPATYTTNATRPTDEELNASLAINNSAAIAARASHFAEIQFNPGSSYLTDKARSAVRQLLLTASKTGKLDDVKILAWSDEEFPAEKQKELPIAQKKLADRRSQAIASYVKTLKYRVGVDRYNMAERANLIERWLNTPDARIKDALVHAGLPTTADDPQFPSKASKSVILVKTR